MIAQLSMYGRPGNRAEHEAFWARIRDDLRAAGIEAPETLSWPDDPDALHDGWARADLVLGQICNLPYRALGLRGRLREIGSCDYGLEGCAPGWYRSHLISREAGADPVAAVQGRLAVNDPLSWSGWGTAHAWATARGVSPGPVVVSGAHAESAAMVRRGAADAAFVDAVTWRLLVAEGATEGLHVLAHSMAAPGQTLVTALPDPQPLRDAFARALSDGPGPAGLRGVVPLPDAAFTVLSTPPPPRIADGP
ncbi:MAG: PhnD/SsuA/transferrin family substrate-binding protein [Paracoccaceae bacterium]